MAFVAPLLLAVGAGGGAAAGLGASLGTALSIGSTVFAGISGFQQAQYQAAVAKNNQKLAERNAALASESSQKEQMRSDFEYAGMLGEQEAAQSVSGLDVLGRSQLAVRNQTQRVGRAAAEDIRAQGNQRVAGFQQEAANFKAERSAAKLQGLSALAEMGLGIGGQYAKNNLLSSRKKTKPWDSSASWYRNG